MTPRIITVIAFVLVVFVSLQCKKDQEPINPELLALDSALQGSWHLEYIFDPVASNYNIPADSEMMSIRDKKVSIYHDNMVIVSGGYKLEVKEHMIPGATRNCIFYKHDVTTQPTYDIVRINGDSLYLYPLNTSDGETTVYSRR
jgi:hypothetical protein